jgi:hypothetical protein
MEPSIRTQVGSTRSRTNAATREAIGLVAELIEIRAMLNMTALSGLKKHEGFGRWIS